jgi:glycosyltransferase involved in cell wall biosynthesis
MQITVPNEFQPMGKSFNVGISAGIESTIYPGEFLEGNNRMDLNLVSSEHSKHVALNTNFEKRDKNSNQVQGVLKSEKPIEVLFEGLDLNKYNKNPQNSGILKDIKEDFCFLFTGHWLPGSFGEDRKDIATLIKTFLETFNSSKKKKPALILKCNQVNYSLLDRETILKHINRIKDQVSGNLPNIYLLHGEMTDDEMNQLNNDNKVKAFVSFTKGEGYGRPLAEAAITGKPVIVSNWSGHTDFIHPDYNILIGGDLKNVHKSAANQWLLKESQWFNINTDIASRAMKDVFKHYKKYLEKSRKQTQYLKDNWSFDKMVEKLNTLLPKVEASPQTQQIKLPKLKKKGEKQELPKLKLPKLKKVEA